MYINIYLYLLTNFISPYKVDFNYKVCKANKLFKSLKKSLKIFNEVPGGYLSSGVFAYVNQLFELSYSISNPIFKINLVWNSPVSPSANRYRFELIKMRKGCSGNFHFANHKKILYMTYQQQQHFTPLQNFQSFIFLLIP